jgi:protein-tyrosine phosphatase
MATRDTTVPAEDAPRSGSARRAGDGAPPVPVPRADGHQRDIGTLVNLRDLGGLPTTDGRLTRTGLLYRSEAPRPGDVPPPPPMVWPPRTVIDLRSATERGTGPHPLIAAGTDVRVMPLFGEEVAREENSRVAAALNIDLAALYNAMLEIAAPRLVDILRLAAEAPAPLLVHCAAGKDRTGVAVALLLRAAGVERSSVLADYAATGPNMPDVLRRLGGGPLLPDGLTTVDVTAVSVAAAERVLHSTDAHPGGVRGWFLAQGASEATLDAWRERAVAP